MALKAVVFLWPPGIFFYTLYTETYMTWLLLHTKSNEVMRVRLLFTPCISIFSFSNHFLCPFKPFLTLYQTTKILYMTKMKAFADDKLNVAKIMISPLDRVENTLGKRENDGNQHFLLFPVFSKPFFFRVVDRL